MTCLFVLWLGTGGGRDVGRVCLSFHFDGVCLSFGWGRLRHDVFVCWRVTCLFVLSF